MYKNRSQDFVGRRYNAFIVLKRISTKTYGNSEWLCKCDCGKEIVMPYRQFRQKKDCGCRINCNYDNKPSQDLTGKRFTKLTVIKVLDHSHPQQGKYWLCKCDCGQELEITSVNLSSNRKSCGCLTRAKKKETMIKRAYAQYKYNANRRWREYEFNITFEDFYKLIEQNCYYCGDAPKKLNGLDRIDNKKGYIKENLVPCCKKCNWIKGKNSQLEMIEHIIKILKNFKKKNLLSHRTDLYEI